MNLDKVIHLISNKANMASTLGMIFLSTEDLDSCEAEMKVDEHSRQPFGYLSGGASIALAETLAGVGTMALCPDKLGVGINVQANHLKPVAEGDVVHAVARILHQGHSMHVWQVSIFDGAGALACSVQVTNFLISRPSDEH